MFLSYNMFFILDESTPGDLYRDRKNNSTYAIIDPFKRDSKGILMNEESSDSVTSSDSSEEERRRDSISRRMHEQFLEDDDLRDYDFEDRLSLSGFLELMCPDTKAD